MLKQNNNVLLMVGVLVVGLIAGLVGGVIGSKITGEVTLSNNAAGDGTYRIRPEGTYADTWLPYSDGSIYLTSNGLREAGFVFRKWTGGTSFMELARINPAGGMTIYSLKTITSDAGPNLAYVCTNSNGKLIRKTSACNGP